MKPASFDYLAPTTVDEAVAALAAGEGEAKVLAGGQSLIPILALRLTRFDTLVDLGRIASLQTIEQTNGDLRIGAMCRQADLEGNDAVVATAPLIARAIPFIGHFQVRNRGTIGGSIAHADPAAELPTVARTLDAVFEIAGPDGVRRVAAQDFFESTFVTALDDGEVLAAVHLQAWGPDSGFAIEEAARRHGDFALAGCASGVRVRNGRVDRAAIGFFGMGSTPMRGDDAEREMIGRPPEDLDFTELGRLAVEGMEPPDDLHASSAYRASVGANLAARALQRAVSEAVSA